MDGIRIGVIGCGYWGSKHVRVMHGVDGASEVALIDERTERLESFARLFPTARGFTSLAEALPHVDAVVVATPPTSHVPIALEAMAAGKHVLVEKPLATSTAGAEQLVTRAAEAGVVLMVGHTFEYNSAIWKLRALIESQALGDIYYLDSARLNLGLYQPDVNVVQDLAPHDVSIMNNLLGRCPDTVEAWAARHAHRRFEDVAYLRLRYSDLDVTANIHVSWLDPCKVRRTTVVGSKKMAVYNDLATEERIRIHDKGVEAPLGTLGDDLTQPPMIYRYGDIIAPSLEFKEPLAVQDQHFVDSILSGTKPHTDGMNGLDVVAVLEAAHMSLERGGSVRLDEIFTRPGSLANELRRQSTPRVPFPRAAADDDALVPMAGAVR
jgi:predicted dehydrogenase